MEVGFRSAGLDGAIKKQRNLFLTRIRDGGVDKRSLYVFLLFGNCFIYKLIETTVCLSG
jgi:hypothetical protein